MRLRVTARIGRFAPLRGVGALFMLENRGEKPNGRDPPGFERLTVYREGLKHTAHGVKMTAEDGDFLRPIVRTVIEEFLEAEMTEAIGAQKGERVEGRSGYRSGYYPRSLITRVGKLELRVPQDRNGRFSTEIFERYQRSEKALVAALTEMYIQGVSTRKVKAISEELCGHSFSASAISGFNKKLDEELGALAVDNLTVNIPIRSWTRGMRK